MVLHLSCPLAQFHDLHEHDGHDLVTQDIESAPFRSSSSVDGTYQRSAVLMAVRRIRAGGKRGRSAGGYHQEQRHPGGEHGENDSGGNGDRDHEGDHDETSEDEDGSGDDGDEEDRDDDDRDSDEDKAEDQQGDPYLGRSAYSRTRHRSQVREVLWARRLEDSTWGSSRTKRSCPLPCSPGRGQFHTPAPRCDRTSYARPTTLHLPVECLLGYVFLQDPPHAVASVDGRCDRR